MKKTINLVIVASLALMLVGLILEQIHISNSVLEATVTKTTSGESGLGTIQIVYFILDDGADGILKTSSTAFYKVGDHIGVVRKKSLLLKRVSYELN